MPLRFTHNGDVILKLIGECVASALREGAMRVIAVSNGSSDGNLADYAPEHHPEYGLCFGL